MTIQDVLNKRHGADGQCVRRVGRRGRRQGASQSGVRAPKERVLAGVGAGAGAAKGADVREVPGVLYGRARTVKSFARPRR
jgi:hypothetical protein